MCPYYRLFICKVPTFYQVAILLLTGKEAYVKDSYGYFTFYTYTKCTAYLPE